MKTKDQKKEVKGYMALRNNVQDIKLDLWKVLTPLEYYLLDLIIDKTIKWREVKAKIDMDWFTQKTGSRKDQVYRALKSLELKQVILKKKIKHDWYFGLHPDFFGGLLIKKHQDAVDRKNKIKLVVDNSKKQDIEKEQVVQEKDPDQTDISSNKQSHISEMIKQYPSLKTLFKDTYLKGEGVLQPPKSETGNLSIESKTQPGGREQKQLSDPEAERKRQLELFWQYEAEKEKERNNRLAL